MTVCYSLEDEVNKMITAFIIGLLAVAAIAVVTIAVISAKWVIGKVKERLAANKRHKVVFADMRETVDTFTKEQKEKNSEYSMADLEKLCQDAPYVFADYDIETGEVLNYTGVRSDEVETEVKSKLKERGGIVVFDS